ncbi:saccharopine dehydrogenase family protein, partial [Xanthomonas citri pv. citri]|nr:saccharopine dehydrogenase family protein [Xanthomonas citri pv. citri]
SKVVIIGCGGVGTVAAFKCAENPDVFSSIVIASRTKSKCDAVAEKIRQATGHSDIVTDRVDADNVDEVVALLRRHNPELV